MPLGTALPITRTPSPSLPETRLPAVLPPTVSQVGIGRAVTLPRGFSGCAEHRGDRRPGVTFGAGNGDGVGDIALGDGAPFYRRCDIPQCPGVHDPVVGGLMFGEPAR